MDGAQIMNVNDMTASKRDGSEYAMRVFDSDRKKLERRGGVRKNAEKERKRTNFEY